MKKPVEKDPKGKLIRDESVVEKWEVWRKLWTILDQRKLHSFIRERGGMLDFMGGKENRFELVSRIGFRERRPLSIIWIPLLN